MDMITDAAQVARHETHRAIANAGSREALGKSPKGEYLTFRLGAEEYGIDILRVQEIRSFEPPTRIANAPAFLKGVVNLRGVIVPIVDLRLKLGCDSAEYNHFTVVIVLNVRGRVVGAVVGLVLKRFSQLREGGYLPFGPFLAGAGFLLLAWGPATVLRWLGLAL